MHAWSRALPRSVACEEHGVKLSAAQAALCVALLLAALVANFDLDWESPSPAVDVIVFDQDFSPQPPVVKEKPEPEPEPEPKPEPKPEAPPKPEPTVAELGAEPEPKQEEKKVEPLPEPETKPLEETLPEPEPELADLSELIEELSETETAAPDPELIDIYRARIKSLIERHLRIPEDTPQDARAVVLMRLRPDGTLAGDPVVEVGSGHADYDSEAVRAVIFAQPYPMPADPAVLNALREIKLTIRP